MGKKEHILEEDRWKKYPCSQTLFAGGDNYGFRIREDT
ncbi:hypothetical protein IX307_000018 [Bacteroides pyogenes]|nr:hypothetical protein [Bacteroides pyogenes]MBR8718901.1 hypothetical protein [Bacteroides pyogenes]MBR8725224.1 hypothetical protein [Bacteroides pyogenes]MBR8738679.1 hypothetical protein [Bacteroides pyogenes]MBR8754421.1 hypothetical protein [Bacteroides pyogenes]